MAKRIGQLLIEAGLITKEQLSEALELQQKKRDFLGKILIEEGFVEEDKFLEVLSEQTKYPIAKIDIDKLDPKLAELIPWRTARQCKCLPFEDDGQILKVAFLDPSNSLQIEVIANKINRKVSIFITGPTTISKGWDKVYGESHFRDSKLLEEGVDKLSDSFKSFAERRKKEDRKKPQAPPAPEKMIDMKEIDSLVSDVLEEVTVVEGKQEESDYALSLAAEGAPIIKMVNGILIKAVEMGASDIHLEPFEKNMRIRFRIDGTLHEVMTLPKEVKSSITSRIKIMAKMDIAERRIPQDGRIKIKIENKGELDLRVNTLPTVFGEKTVIRILGQSNLQSNVADLGFEGKALEWIQMALKGTYGMILVTGPTGSGKSTTLYTMLNQINSVNVNITTAEDPVEYHLDGITQVNIHQSIGFTFDVALRAFLRQDPDVIMVGEMRDAETVDIAVKAALTGHLVLSTLHTNDAPSTITRLFDMKVEPFLVAASVKVIIAQRLVRKLCEHCKRQLPISEEDKQQLRLLGLSEEEIESLNPYYPQGCPKCNNIGYKGRKAVFEVMSLHSRRLREIISKGADSIEIATVAREEGMITLKDAVLLEVKRGITSLEEAFKIAVSD